MWGAWQGKIGQVLEELHIWQAKRREPPEDIPDHDPRKILANRIKYPEYR